MNQGMPILKVTAAANKKKITNKSGELVTKTRDKFLEKLSNEDRQFFYEQDIEKVQEDDWFVKRFLLVRSRNPDDAATMMIDALKWRRSEDIRNLKPSYFPDDLFRISSMFIYAPDKEGNLTVYFRVRYILRIPELVQTVKKFGNYLLYQIDEATQGNGITGVADFQGTGIQNADIDLLFYSINTLRNYFPAGINHILIVDLPWILRACWSMAKSWVPEKGRKMVEFITRKELTKFIDKENLPDFLNGTCELPYKTEKVVPRGSPSTVEFCVNTLGLSASKAEKISAQYRPIVDGLESGMTIVENEPIEQEEIQ